jgi:antirestriction protein
MDSPRVWRACLACYNEGSLVGAWIDAADVDAIYEFDKAHETATGHEEFAIHDYDGMPSLGEYPNLDDVRKIAEAVEQYGYAVVKAFVDWLGVGDIEKIRDAYRGEFNNEEDFAAEFAEEIGLFDGCSETLRMYFDFEAYARDLFMGDYYSAHVDGGVVVFDGNT